MKCTKRLLFVKLLYENGKIPLFSQFIVSQNNEILEYIEVISSCTLNQL